MHAQSQGRHTLRVLYSTLGVLHYRCINLGLCIFKMVMKVPALPTYVASLLTQLVKNQPAIQETWVRSLAWEDSLAKGKDTQFGYSGLENSMNYRPWVRRLRHN